MTRKSKRELERVLDDLSDQTASESEDIVVVKRDTHSGEIRTLDGEPVEQDLEEQTVVVINETIVMDRERAEEAGREILGPAESAPPGRDAVRVAPERGEDR